MNRSILTFLCCGFLIGGNAGRAAEFKFPTRTFTIPDGFEMEMVASPPMVERPIEVDFDEQGHLYVTDSSGSNEAVEKQLQDKPHRIVRLEDTDGDGRFDKSVVFADKMMFPEGAMWLDGSLYASAPPSIWKLTDTDGDGVADKREEWFQGKTLGHCANDLHGPYLGPDGWIYWCKGAFAKQTYERPGKTPLVTRAAHIFRARPDGTGIESVMAGGMDNPVGVTFTSEGERIFTSTFIDLSGAGKRDGVAHAIYGGVYGKIHDVTDDHIKTGELMPVMTQLGPAAPCGITRYQSRAFGAQFQNNLFVCQFNLHKISRHVIQPDGATFKTQESDFVTSDTTDFHPTDVIEDADGSLLIIDTGGWYKICCPTSQLYKPDILGAIYRIRKKGVPKIEDPRGVKLAWTTMKPADLVQLLGDRRPAVRNRAVQSIAKLGDEAISALGEVLSNPKSFSIEARRNAVWALCRFDSPQASKLMPKALRDEDPTVQHAALHRAALLRDSSAIAQVNTLVAHENVQLVRPAAEALGRIISSGGSNPTQIRDAVSALLNNALYAKDRVLEHSLIYALIEIGDVKLISQGLQGASAELRRVAMIALDQIGGKALDPDTVAPLLASNSPVLKQTASWIVKHHPEWGNTLSSFFQERLASPDLSDKDRADLEMQLGEFSRTSTIQDLLAKSAQDAQSQSSQLIALRAMARAGLKDTPQVWTRALTGLLTATDVPLLRQVVATARTFVASKSLEPDYLVALVRVARTADLPSDVRLDAMAAVGGGWADLSKSDFEFLLSQLAPTNPVSVRSAAAGVLSKAKLNLEQLATVAESLKNTGPLEVPRLLGAFDTANDESLGLKLLEALKESKGSMGLRAETLKPHLTNFPMVVQQQADTWLASLNVDATKQRTHLDELMASLKDGDIRRGQMIFNSPKAACSSCHAIGYLGGNVGPDLTKIGQIRSERDLLESIVYPSASFVRSYEPVVVATKSGDEHSGVLRKDSSEELILATGPGTEVKLARRDVAEVRPGSVSVMPAGLDEQLSRQELADLLAFLKATKW